MMHLLGLTLWRPWPAAIAYHNKRLENRDWRPSPSLFNQRIALHAGQRFDEDAFASIALALGLNEVQRHELRHAIPASHVFALARVVGLFAQTDIGQPRRLWPVDGADLAPAQRRWFSGPFGWELADVVVIEPVGIRGRQKLWALPDQTAREVLRRAEEVTRG